MRSAISRRKVIAISAAAAGVALVPFGASRRAAAAHLVEWTGRSLGGVATIRLHHPDRRSGEHLLRRVVAEAQRLEAIFSLYRTDTALSELNQRGVLVAPPVELVDLLRLCERFWQMTGGVFDPTVQPVWQCYVDHFSTVGARPEGPDPRKLEGALRRVGWPKVAVGRDRVVFAHREMGLTLNGIAQGYITDRVVDMLRMAAIESCLVDIGEIRTLGAHPDGQPWQVAVRDPTAGAVLHALLDTTNRAVATSGADGFLFDKVGRCNHLFNPATGLCADPGRSLTVIADTTCAADALSTAFSLMDENSIARMLARSATTQVYVTTVRGTREIRAG